MNKEIIEQINKILEDADKECKDFSKNFHQSIEEMSDDKINLSNLVK